ncbi:MAG: prenyltransferase/squalene oxidase repeat-containing protein [Rhodanobacter sp.]
MPAAWPALARASRDPLAPALQRARDYLLERQSPGGGFCFSRGDYLQEPNLADTWHGVGALTGLLGVDLPEQRDHAGFVLGQAVDPQPLALCYRIRSLQALQTSDLASAEVECAVAALQVSLPDPATPHLLGAALQRLSCVLWLRKHVGLDVAADELAQALLGMANEDGGYGEPCNLLDTACAIAVLAQCDAMPAPATRAFLSSVVDPQFGFRLSARAPAPNLETVHAGAASCRRLELDIPHAGAAASFVLSCQRGSGGFARTSHAFHALPDMTLTYMALATLIRDLPGRSSSPDVPAHGGMPA